jgi:hypothetical protein
MDENGDLLANSHNISDKRKNRFSQLLHVYVVNDVRQTEIHTAGHSTRVEAGSNTSTVNLRVVRGDKMGLKKAAP